MKCFFRGETCGSAGFHEAASCQLVSRFKLCALILDDMDQLTLKPGDMVADEDK